MVNEIINFLGLQDVENIRLYVGIISACGLWWTVKTVISGVFTCIINIFR